jgi:predicted kinase
MPKLIWTKGLPGCGKSTEALKRQEKDPTIVLVSKDDLRRMLHGDKWSAKNEKQVLRIRNAIIEDSLSNGRSVIVHDTNLAPKHEMYFLETAKKYNLPCECIDLTDVPVDECIKRDLKRLHSVGERVIRGMYAQFLAPAQNLKIDNPKSLPLAIICDLDGTLAHGLNRSYYGETEKYLDDEVNEPLLLILRSISHKPPSAIYSEIHIIFVSGREEEGRKWTEQWLDKVCDLSKYEALYMRATGDQRPDYVVKEEILKFIQAKYCVIASIDDRPQVIRKTWVKNGIFTLSANQYEVEF